MEKEAMLRKWGGSFGLRVTKKTVLQEGWKEGDIVRFLPLPKNNPVRESFGKLKLKKPTAQLMRELDREMWHE
jgi:hypothetical protein